MGETNLETKTFLPAIKMPGEYIIKVGNTTAYPLTNTQEQEPRQADIYEPFEPAYNPMLRERLTSIPDRLKTAGQDTIEIGRSIRNDIKDSEDKARTWRSFVGCALVGAASVPRIPAVLGLMTASVVYKNTGAAPVAAVASAMSFGSWCYLSARVNNNFVSHFPKAFQAASKGMPAVEKLPKLFPSLNDEEKRDSILGRYGANLKHGIGAYACLSPQIWAAGMLKQSKEERLNLCKKMGWGGAAFMGTLALGTTSAITALEKNHPTVAKSMLSYAENPKAIFLTMVALAASTPARMWAYQKIGGCLPESIKSPSLTFALGATALKLGTRKPRRQALAIGTSVRAELALGSTK